MSRIPHNKITTEQYQAEINEKYSGEFTVLGEYVDSKSSILIRHNVCGYEWLANAGTFKKTGHCKHCERQKLSHRFCKTQEDFETIIAQKFGTSLKVLSKYTGAHNKILVRHICGHEWYVKANTLLYGKGECPFCEKSQRQHTKIISEEQFRQRIVSQYGDLFSIDSAYNGSNSVVNMHCNRCGIKWTVLASKIMHGRPGHICIDLLKAKQRKNPQVYIKELQAIWGNDYKLLSQYIDTSHKVKVQHTKCGHVWDVLPSQLLSGHGCPRCNRSLAEITVEKILQENNICYQTQYSFADLKYKKTLRFDFAIFDNEEHLVLLIELDGEQHYKPVKFFGGTKKYQIQQVKDKLKNEYCNKNNIALLRLRTEKIEDITVEILNRITGELDVKRKQGMERSQQGIRKEA